MLKATNCAYGSIESTQATHTSQRVIELEEKISYLQRDKDEEIALLREKISKQKEKLKTAGELIARLDKAVGFLRRLSTKDDFLCWCGECTTTASGDDLCDKTRSLLAGAKNSRRE